MRLRHALWALALIFLTTGAAGLLAEQCFEKLLTTLLGASTPAVALVLAAYFLGLTLGAAAYPRWALLGRRPLLTYACLEAGVALWSALLLIGWDLVVRGCAPLLSLGQGSFYTLQLLRGIVALLWIVPPSALMGATFPAVADVLEAWRVPRPRKLVSAFYSVNLLGAIVGAVFGPYWSFPRWGLSGTMALVALADGLAALGAVALARLVAVRMTARPRPEAAYPAPPPLPRVLLVLSAISGLLFFSLEVLWTHLLAVVIGNSVYAFAAMLALVLIGLGVGGFLATVLFPARRPVPVWAVGWTMLAGSALVAWQHQQWPEIPRLFVVWGGNLTTFGQGELLRWIQAGRVLLPPAVALGILYPTLFRLPVFPVHGRGRAVGELTAWNAGGCIVGALLTGFFLIPQLGSETTSRLLGLLMIMGSVLVVLAFGRGPGRWIPLAAAVGVAVYWSQQPRWDRLALTHGGHVNFQQQYVVDGTRLLYFRETSDGITTVVANASRGGTTRVLLTNGKFQASDAGELAAQIGFPLIPILHVAKNDAALVIGLGSGHSAAVVEGMGFRSVEVAEISAAVADAARRHFEHLNGRLLEKPNVRVWREDGRNQLLLTRRRYDLITMEISNVWFAGATNLYSREFYAVAARRLESGGILQQWVQLHHLSMREIGSILATVRAVFPYVSLWVYGNQGIVLGSMEPQRVQGWAAAHLQRWSPWQGRAADTEAQLLRVLRSRVLAPADVDRLVAAASFTINTDWNRYLEYSSPRYNIGRQAWMASNKLALAQAASYPGHELAGEWLPHQRALVQGLSPAAHRAELGLEAISSSLPRGFSSP